MASPDRGDVWLVDLGMLAKIRPCLVLSIPPDEETDRVLVTVVAHTTSPRGSRFEVSVPVDFLRGGVRRAESGHDSNGQADQAPGNAQRQSLRSGDGSSQPMAWLKSEPLRRRRTGRRG